MFLSSLLPYHRGKWLFIYSPFLKELKGVPLVVFSSILQCPPLNETIYPTHSPDRGAKSPQRSASFYEPGPCVDDSVEHAADLTAPAFAWREPRMQAVLSRHLARLLSLSLIAFRRSDSRKRDSASLVQLAQSVLFR